MAAPILVRLNDKTIKDEKTGCWLWKGGNDGWKNYGSIRFNGIKTKVHRVSAHLYHGLNLQDKNLQALHKLNCPNKNCWNPEHLYIGTHSDNVSDMVLSGILLKRPHRRKTGIPHEYCKRHHKLIDDNLYFRQDGMRRCKTCHDDYTMRKKSS